MAFSRELEEVLAELTERTEELEESWRSAKVADRVMATQRFLAEGKVSEGQAAKLEELNIAVQRLWTDVRRHRASARDAHDQLYVHSLETDLKQAELKRDGYMDEQNLVEELLCCSETFLLESSRPAGETFRDLVRRKDQLVSVVEATTPAATLDGAPHQTQKVAVVYSLTGEQIHSHAA